MHSVEKAPRISPRGVMGEAPMFADGRISMYDDRNDGGATGWGIMTNEPPFDWQLRNVEHMLWKGALARSAVAVPGG